jgi:DNA/RNA endonuclease YhcR with UshA esterase domain
MKTSRIITSQRKRVGKRTLVELLTACMSGYFLSDILILTAVALVLTIAPAAAGQKSEPAVAVPKYDLAAEATFKGTVEEVKDRQCPVSGGMGSHLILRLSPSKTIEVHLATTKFVKTYDLVFNKGDVVTVVGTKVQFEGVETIFAREVSRGDAAFTFRDQHGAPIW